MADEAALENRIDQLEAQNDHLLAECEALRTSYQREIAQLEAKMTQLRAETADKMRALHFVLAAFEDTVPQGNITIEGVRRVLNTWATAALELI